MNSLYSLLRKNLGIFPPSAVSSSNGQSLEAEALEPRILYSAAPVEAPAAEPEAAQEAPAVASPAPAQELAPAVQAPVAVEVPAEVAAADGEGAVSENAAVELVDVDDAAASLNQETVEILAAEARQRWIDSGISAEQIAALDSVSYDIADVGGAHLGVANGFSITIDDDAGGTGVDRWFIDATPEEDGEFGAIGSNAAGGRYDLLSTLIHEQGHVLGLGDLFGDRSDVMDGFLEVGTRRLPVEGQAMSAVAGSVQGASFLTADLVMGSTNFQGNQATGGSSSGASLSADGRFLVFESDATNLPAVGSDTNGLRDIFVKELATGIVDRVNTDAAGTQSIGGDSYGASISADGRFVAFSSDATNLVANDTNGAADVFVKNVFSGEIVRVSTNSSGGQVAGHSFDTSISADGRYVAFLSSASDLVAGDTNGNLDVFVKDLKTGTITRASTSSTGAQSTGISIDPSISADGRFVAFESFAADLVTGDTNGVSDIFRKNLRTGEVTRVSTDSSGTQSLGGGSFAASLSADGNFVAFVSGADDLVSGDSNGMQDTFVKNVQTGVTLRVSTDSNGNQATGGFTSSVSISGDGRFVAFGSNATNLVSGDTNALNDIFVKDLQTGAIVRASTNAAGGEATLSLSLSPAISADGRFVAFESFDNDLLAPDTNNETDIFVKGLAPFVQTFTTSVEIDAMGNLVIEDVDGANTDDRLFIEQKNGRLEISDKKATVGSSMIGSTLLGTKGRGVTVSFESFTGDIIIKSRDGKDSITIGDLNFLPGGITIEDGVGQSTIRQTGVVTLQGSESVFYNAEVIRLDRGSALNTDSGTIGVGANTGSTALGRSIGVYSNGSMLTSNSGIIAIVGRGGDKGNGNVGVSLRNTQISTAGDVTVSGEGGGGIGSGNAGLILTGGSKIESGSEMFISGSGGNFSKSASFGIRAQDTMLTTTGANLLNIEGNGKGTGAGGTGIELKRTNVTATGSGVIILQASGSSGATGARNFGVVLKSTMVSSAGGAVFVSASGGTGTSSNSGLHATGSTLQSQANNVTINANSTLITTKNANQGIYFSKGTISAGNNLTITATGGGGRSSNSALTLNSSELNAAGMLSITAEADAFTTGSSNRGADIRNTNITGSQVTVTATGGGGTSNNSGLRIRGGTILGSGAMLELEGTAKSSTTRSNNFGVSTSRTNLFSANGTEITGVGGGGVSGNFGTQIVSGFVDAGGGDTTITGTADMNTLGANNRGVKLSKAEISGSSITINGAAGSGTSNNEGLHINGGTLNAVSDQIDLDGAAQAGTTGSKNSGIYLNKVGVQAVNQIAIDGSGGGGRSSNYGVFVNRTMLTSPNSFVNINGAANSATTRSSNTGLHFFHSVLSGTSSFIGGTGGDGTSNNRGIYIRGGSLTAIGGAMSIVGDAVGTTDGNRNVGVDIVGATIEAESDLFMMGAGGGGKNNNAGLAVRNGTIISQVATVTVSGNAAAGTLGSKNHGVDLLSTSVTGSGLVTMSGFGGGGVNDNQGVRIVKGSVKSLIDNVDINGTALDITTGKRNTGVFIFNGVEMDGVSTDIFGDGGGGMDLNHGMFLDRGVEILPMARGFLGIAGAGPNSVEQAGDFDYIP